MGIAMLSALLGCSQEVPTEPNTLKSSAQKLRARLLKHGTRGLLLFCFCTCVFIAVSHYRVMKSNASLQLALMEQESATLEATELGEHKNNQLAQLQHLLKVQRQRNKELVYRVDKGSEALQLALAKQANTTLEAIKLGEDKDNQLAELKQQLHMQRQQHIEELMLAKSGDNCWTRLWLR